MLHTLLLNDVIALLHTRFGSVPSDLKREIERFIDPEDLEALLFDINKCETLDAVKELTTWMVGKHFGRLDGLKEAVFIALGVRGDKVAEQISEDAFLSRDRQELEELLKYAIESSGWKLSVN